MAKLTVVPRTSSAAAVEVTPEFIEEFEGAYADVLAHPGTEMRVEFEDEAERNAWLRMARAHGENRTDPKDPTRAAKLKVRATPKRGLPKTVAYLSITHDAEANGAANAHQTERPTGRKGSGK